MNSKQNLKAKIEKFHFDELFPNRVAKENLSFFKKKWILYAMMAATFIFIYLFRYRPIGGILVAFKDYNGSSISESPFVGFYHFRNIMFGSIYRVDFWRAFRNTFAISFYGLIYGFPIPILLALFFSEIKVIWYRTITQILTYLPKFISTVVVTSIIWLMFKPAGNTTGPGILTNLFYDLGLITRTTEDILSLSNYFIPVFTVSGIWEEAGYGSIIYFAAIMAISPTNYEAAKIDGANKIDQIRYVTLPGMAPTLIIMLILRIGQMLMVGYEKVYLLTLNKGTRILETGDVISTFVIRVGGIISAQDSNVSTGAAADLFNSLIAMALVLGSNFISRKVSDTSLF